MHRLLQRVLAAACLTAAAVTGLPVTSAPAATVVTGNDYSWPQCPKGVGNGQGQPLPAGSRTFAVVGLTNGVARQENPCLASMWSYARAHSPWVTAYTMVTYPTPAQRAAAGTGRYGVCHTLTCRLRNAGWAEGDFADASLRKLGAHPPLVWIDVEPRKHQGWSRSRSANSTVVKAAVASLQAHGYSVGIYSNRLMWHDIAGYRTSLPEWVPAGSLTAGCRMSFAGGRVLLSQWTRTIRGRAYDENGRCPGSPSVYAWWQRSHPVVTSLRNAASGRLFARWDARRAVWLGASDPAAASVVAAPSAAGTVPLFVSETATGTVHARTLGSGWMQLGTSPCAGPAAPAIVARTLSVTCVDGTGQTLVTTTPLTSLGSPAGPGTSAYVDPSAGGAATPRTTAARMA